MHSDIAIRSVEPADFTEWKSLWEEFNSYFDRTVEHQITDRTWNRFFETDSRIFAVVAERVGALMGFAHFVFHPNSDREGDSCYLQDLFTRESDRGQGIGRALVYEIQAIARRERASTLYFQTAEDNGLGTEFFDRIANRENTCIYKLRVQDHRRHRTEISVNAAAA